MKQLVKSTVFSISRAAYALMILVAMASFAPITWAQDDGYRIPHPDKLLIAFAQLRERIDTIRSEYTERINETSDESQRDDLVKEANAKAAKAVRESILSYDQYSRIATDMNHDPELRRRLRFLLRKLSSGNGSGRSGSP